MDNTVLSAKRVGGLSDEHFEMLVFLKVTPFICTELYRKYN